MCPKNKSINRLKNLKYRNIYIKIDRNRMLDIVIHYSYVWNLSRPYMFAAKSSSGFQLVTGSISEKSIFYAQGAIRRVSICTACSAFLQTII
jgi:hypothetical protein